MQKFGLESVDIAYLIKSNKVHIDSLLAGEGSIELETSDKIAQLFGLHYYEFAHPKQKIPRIDVLPEPTKKRIRYRKTMGPYQPTTYSPRLLNHKILIVLSEYDEMEEFLSEHIVRDIAKKFNEQYSTSEISKRLTDHLQEYVVRTTRKDESKAGRGRKPYYFKLIKKISLDERMMEELKR